MSQANLWTALQQSALVGADRLAVPSILTKADASTPASVQAVQMALQQPAASSAAQVLRASAVAAVLERTGWVPGSQIQLKAPLTAPAMPAPPQPLARYAGHYANAYYGDAQVVLDTGGTALDLVLGPAHTRYRLRHHDGDLFAFDLQGENAPPGSVSAVQFSPGRMQIELYAGDLAHGLFEHVADGR